MEWTIQTSKSHKPVDAAGPPFSILGSLRPFGAQLSEDYQNHVHIP